MRPQDVSPPDARTAAARPARINRVAAVAFLLGGSLFALGAFLAQTGDAILRTVNVTYLVGGFFFSTGGYLSILLVVVLADPGHRGAGVGRIRADQHPAGWLSAVVLFVGTCLFAVSLVAAFAQGLTPRQSNGWIWLPDILGCLCFLASGHLALRDLHEGTLADRTHHVGWWVAIVNQVGSYLFFLAGIAAFTRPATSTVVNTGLVNWGTFAGAVCFAVGGAIQAFDTPTPTRTVVQDTP